MTAETQDSAGSAGSRAGELLVYVNGDLVPKSQAVVSVYDHGFLYGDGIFEGIRSYGDEVLLLDMHLERLYRSAHFLQIEIGMSLDEMRDAVLNTLKANRLYDGAYIRLVVSRGLGDLGINPHKCIYGPSVIIITDTIQLYPPKFYETGIPTVVSSIRKNHPQCLNAQVKATQYLNNIMAVIEANNAEVLEAIMLTVDGYVAEGTADNIFIAKGRELTTPPAHLGILRGITRDSVMKLARERGYEVNEGLFTTYELYEADECWFTGTGAELIPIISIDGRKVGTGKPGPIFKELKEAYAAFIREHGTKIPR